MTRWLRALAATAAVVSTLGIVSARANAATLALSPASAGPIAGTIVLDVMVGGLGGTPTTSVGAYDLRLGYDPSLVAFVGFTYQPALGVFPGEAKVASSGGSGIIDFAAVSYLDAVALAGRQATGFVLGQITLQAIGTGTAVLSFARTELADGLGLALLPIDAAAGATLDVVPEPSVALLAGAGLAGLALRRRTRCQGGLQRVAAPDGRLGGISGFRRQRGTCDSPRRRGGSAPEGS
jgi:hypothetical protein